MDSVLDIIISGLAAGFMLAAPVGPVGVLCVRRTLSEGRAIGLVSGLGAATADAIFGGIVGFGVTWLSDLLEAKVSLLQFVGGAFLCFLGVYTYLARPTKETEVKSFSGLATAFSTTFFLTIINPITMLGFAAYFASFGVFSAGRSALFSGLLVGSVFIGSAIWWLGIVAAAALMRGRLQYHHLRWLNRFVGILITAFGALALLQLMWTNKSIFDSL